ncbi:MAG TPA: hypothetical protein VHV74_25390 [Pseudonocardiaceae bacterium]|nr:hypothetical protein [Pseudonocardiaceae bacterium]
MTSPLSPTRGAPRVWRGLLLATTSATLAITAHAMAGGAVPDTVLTLLPAVAVAAIGIGMAGKRHSMAGVLALLGCAQLVTHVLLSIETTNMAGMPADGLTMIGAHAVAVACTAFLLIRADDAMFAVAAALARLLPTVVAPPPVPAVPARLRPAAAPVARSISVLWCRANSRRGPPVGA